MAVLYFRCLLDSSSLACSLAYLAEPAATAEQASPLADQDTALALCLSASPIFVGSTLAEIEDNGKIRPDAPSVDRKMRRKLRWRPW